MRTAALLFLLAGPLSADVVVLKDGRKFGGTIVQKAGHVEVTGPDGLRTFLKEEIERVVTSPDDLLGDSATLLDEAKREFLKTLEMKDLNRQNPILKGAIAKLTRARETYAETRELFPEDRWSDLDRQLVQVMQLLRLMRSRLGSEIAAKPRTASVPVPAPPPPPTAPPPPAAPAPPNTSTIDLDDAFAILVDPGKRTKSALRTVARDSFRERRAAFSSPDLATAAMIFLSGEEAGGDVLQKHLSAWLAKPAALTPDRHLEAATSLAAAYPSARTAGADDAEAVRLFALGHLGHAKPGPAVEKLARTLQLETREGMIGTPEGHAALDLARWIAAGDYDLAALAYHRQYRSSVNSPTVRFLRAYALLLQAQERKRGFDAPVKALAEVKASDPAFRAHAEALAKSVRAVAVCSRCGGAGKVRCTTCHGLKEKRLDCSRCRGTGAIRAGGLRSCPTCKGQGYLKLVRCTRCKDGFPACGGCDRKPRKPPALSDIFVAGPCPACDGSGMAFRRVALPCNRCKGLGQKLTPRADPAKVLP